MDENLPDRPHQILQNKTVFLTGGSGFLGKVIIERLLRAFDIEKVYILIRPKKGKTPQDRLNEIFTNPLFDIVRGMKGEEIFKKCQAISGDMIVAHMDINPKERTMLIKEVDFVIHSAATVRFDDPIKTAVDINTAGTKRMLELAKEMEKLQLFVYVSTAYCHPEEGTLYEKIYDPPADPQHILDLVNWMDEKRLDTITPVLLGTQPNTYSFSKALAEELIANYMDDLPVVIVRPSIVVPIWKGPVPGWTDNINGPMGILIAAGKGVIRSMYGNKHAYADFISVDGVADAIFCVMAHSIFTQRSKKIFNLCTSNEVVITWGEVIDIGRSVSLDVPFDMILWRPGGGIRKSYIAHTLAVIFYHYLPALIVDALAYCFGYKPFLWKIQKRISTGMQVLEYYTSHQWHFSDTNFICLRKWLNPKEKSIYVVDPDGVVYRDYFTDCTYAARRFILKEPDENLPRARRMLRIMYWLDIFFNVMVKLLLAYFFYSYVYKYVIAPFHTI